MIKEWQFSRSCELAPGTSARHFRGVVQELFETMRRHEKTKQQHGSSGRRAALWLLVPPLLVLAVIKTNLLPQVARCKSSYFPVNFISAPLCFISPDYH